MLVSTPPPLLDLFGGGRRSLGFVGPFSGQLLTDAMYSLVGDHGRGLLGQPGDPVVWLRAFDRPQLYALFAQRGKEGC